MGGQLLSVLKLKLPDTQLGSNATLPPVTPPALASPGLGPPPPPDKNLATFKTVRAALQTLLDDLIAHAPPAKIQTQIGQARTKLTEADGLAAAKNYAQAGKRLAEAKTIWASAKANGESSEVLAQAHIGKTDAAADKGEHHRGARGPNEKTSMQASTAPSKQSVLDAAEDHTVGSPNAQATPGNTPAAPMTTRVTLAGAEAAPGGATLKIGADVELLTKEIKKDTKYGDLKISVSIKLAETLKTGDGPVEVSVTGTSKDTSKRRNVGTKKAVSYKDIDDREIFAGLTLDHLSVGGVTEISGTDFNVSVTVSGNVTTKAFSAPAQVTLVLVKIKDGKDFQVLGGEVKIEPYPFSFKVHGVETKLRAEFKAAFAIDLKKVGLQIGKKALRNYAEKQVEKLAIEQGAKFVGREAAEMVLRDLGPIALALSIGLDVGELLNAFTVAPEYAKAVDEDILGDLNTQYQNASILGKIALIHENLPRIGAALIASGVIGTVSGLTDLLVCKLLHLDRLGDALNVAYEVFQDLLQAIPNVFAGLADLNYGAVFTIGIKYNPSHHSVADPNLSAIAAAVFSEIKPLYKKNGGLDTAGMKLQDIGMPEAALTAAVAMIFRTKKNYAGQIDLTDEKTTLGSFMELSLQDFLFFMQGTGLISYKVKLPEQLGLEAIDLNLLAELLK
jgi:hypothetical protein